MLESFDLKPLKIYPHINSQMGYRTKIGGIAMMFLGCLSLFCIIAFGLDTVKKTNFSVVSSDVYSNNLVIEKANLNVSFGAMLHGGFNIPDFEKLLEFQIHVYDTDGYRVDEPTIETSFSPKPCVSTKMYKENFFNYTNNYIGDPVKYYCFATEDKSIKDLKNKFGQAQFILWVFTLNYCKNSTLNNNSCKNMEDIKSDLKKYSVDTSLWVHFVYSDSYIDSNDYTDPIKETYGYKLLRVDPTTTRSDILFYKKLEYFSDIGLILKQNEHYSGYFYSYYETSTFYMPETTELMRIQMTIDNIFSHYQRTYVKIQKVAADIGGFIKFFLIILYFISSNYSQLHFYNYLIEYYFDYLNKNKIPEFNKRALPKTTDSKYIEIDCSSQLNINVAVKKSTIMNHGSKIQKNNFLNNNTSKVEIIKENIKDNVINKCTSIDLNTNEKVNIGLMMFFKYYTFMECCKTNRIRQISAFKNYFTTNYTLENVVKIFEEQLYIKRILFGSKVRKFEVDVVDALVLRAQNNRSYDEIDFNEVDKVNKLCQKMEVEMENQI